MKSIFWFRRDLRIQDNIGLQECLKNSEEVFPLFILDPFFLDKCPDKDPRLGFLKSALENLDKSLKSCGNFGLNIFYGNPEEIFPQILHSQKIDAIFTNQSVSNYGKSRDQKIAKIIGTEKFKAFHDATIIPPEKIETRKVYSAFYRLWEKERISRGSTDLSCHKIPQNIFQKLDVTQVSIDEIFQQKISYAPCPYWPIPEEINIADFFPENFPNYSDTRDQLPNPHSTTKIAPYLRFGLISPRGTFQYVQNFPYDTTVYQKELAWREFWIHIHQRFPETEKVAFQEKRRNISWQKNEAFLEAWKTGRTGYPIIDAAMRQLNKENWMHNRARMFTASFLTKNLHIDWREGERYFAEKLLDYDHPINIGNWQWSASIGADPKPLRIFSPARQTENFDPDAKYIKKYCTELVDFPAKNLVDPVEKPIHDLFSTTAYPRPIIDAKSEANITKLIYKKSTEE